MVVEMIIRIKFFKLLHMFVLLLLCLRYPTLGLTSRVGDDGNTNIKCIEREREGLLKFKQGLIDEYGHLSSWGSEEEKKNCCSWRGVHCSYLSGHVIMLDLHNSNSFDTYKPLRGKISPSLLELQHLNYLDLSYNDFEGSFIPEFIGSLSRLQYMKLTDANFGGTIPCQLGNLTNLHFLDLSDNHAGLNVKNLEWLSDLSLLKHLDLSYVDLSEVINWVEAIITKLPLLTELRLAECKLSDVIPPSIFLNNSTKSLATLDLSGNSFESRSLYRWLFNFSITLVHIDLSNCNLQGMIPDAFGNMIALENLDLFYNQLEGGVPKTFGNLSVLQSLNLSWNSLNVPFPKLLQNLSGQAENSLQLLRLRFNQLTGSFPDITLFSSLRELDLFSNNLNGSLSKSCATPPSLEILDLSWNWIGGSLPDLSLSSSLKTLNLRGNHLEGIISEAHFVNLSSLKFLDLSRNSLVLNFSSDWLPPFQLDQIRLCHCQLGPHFPKWLRTQNNFSEIDFSDNKITDTIPKWFWNQSPRLNSLNLSYNQLYGMLPNLSSKFNGYSTIDLSCNKFKGPIPLLPPNATSLNLSKNMFSGPISFLCNSTVFLLDLDLSDNLLSGELPDCWIHMKRLKILKLANNEISGKIPTSMGYLDNLETLQFRNNSFTGELPSTLRNCTRLLFIDLGENNFSGTIPEWIGSLSYLMFLTIQSNQFFGIIPLSMCHLQSIQILDLSLNNISGTLPKCLNKFTTMAHESSSNFHSTISNSVLVPIGEGGYYDNTGFLTWKGREAVYKNTLGLVIGIDISRNKLTGKIPEEIADLVGLLFLNLSGNDLTGGIPRKIGQLTSLDSLDLSNNQLSGEIPTSLSEISRLSVLDLSNNKLSGRIPFGTQLQSFNASTYMGNPGLCGAPLEETCPAEKIAEDPPNDQNRLITQGFYVSVGLGFVVGFWGVCITLLLNSSWRSAFFKLLEKIEDWFFVMFAVYTTRLKRKLQLYRLKLGAAMPSKVGVTPQSSSSCSASMTKRKDKPRDTDDVFGSSSPNSRERVNGAHQCLHRTVEEE